MSPATVTIRLEPHPSPGNDKGAVLLLVVHSFYFIISPLAMRTLTSGN